MRLLVVVHRKRHGVYREGRERESGGKRRGDDKTFLVTVRFHLDTVECGWNVNKEGDELGGGASSLWSGHRDSAATQRNVKSLDSTRG